MSVYGSLVLRLVCFASLLGASESLFKKWVPNTNFNNIKNWDAGRLPCRNDRLVFPDTAPPVYFQANATVMEVVLPRNGELVLAQYSSLSFSSEVDPNDCQGQDNRFVRTDPVSWFDPDSWCEVSDPEAPCMSDPPPRLDTERLPCKTDDAIFPRGSTFLVDLDRGVDIYIGKLQVAGKQYDTGSFRRYIDTAQGQKQFVRQAGPSPTTVNVQGFPCNEMSGCPCENDQGEIQRRICSIQEDKCSTVVCGKPLHPHGSCCKMCGAVLELEYGNHFKMKSLNSLIHNSVAAETKDKVEVSVSKTIGDCIQVVVQDLSSDPLAVGVAQKIKRSLEDDMNRRRKYGVTDVLMHTSQQQAPSAGALESSQSMSGGSIAGLVIAILVLLLLIAVAMFCFMDRRSLSGPRSLCPTFKLPFQRFETKDEGRAGMELGAAASLSFKDNVAMYQDFLGGFDNPMYDTPSPVKGEPSKAGAVENIAAGSYGNGNMLDPTQATFVKGAGGAQGSTPADQGFSNPLYAQKQEPVLRFTEPAIKFNPMYSEEGIEEDSEI